MMDKKADSENPNSWPSFILRVDRYMCNYLTSGKRTKLAVLSSSLKVWILLKVRTIHHIYYVAILDSFAQALFLSYFTAHQHWRNCWGL